MPEAIINHFLLVFDHSADELIHCEEFDGRIEDAMEAYARMEDAHSSNRAIDIVLVGSDSIESVKVTHSTYFPGFRDAVRGGTRLEQLLAG